MTSPPVNDDPPDPPNETTCEARSDVADLPAPGLPQRAAVNYARRIASDAAAGFLEAADRLAGFPDQIDLLMTLRALARKASAVARPKRLDVTT